MGMMGRIGMVLGLFAVSACAMADEKVVAVESGAPQSLELARKGGPELCLFTPLQDPSAQRAVKTWKTFFELRGCPVRVIPPSTDPKFPRAGAVMAIESEEICPVAMVAKTELDGLKDARPESHVLLAKVWDGRPLILVVGKTSAGADWGAEHLLSKVACRVGADGAWTVQCEAMKTLRRPFFRSREATLCPTGRCCPKEPVWVNYEHWDKERLERYPAFLKACGFNSVQLMELVTYHHTEKTNWQGGYRGGLSRGKTIQDIRKALFTLADAAHACGMTVSQYIWGSPDGNFWANPKTRPTRELFYIELARVYGAKVDHIITHWVDEGNEGGFETPLAATMFLWNEYKKHNPNVKVTCDAWWNPSLYSGIGDEKFAAKDVAIGIERWYDAARAEQIIKAGRKVGIWGWYLSDFEMTYGSHLYTKTLDKYFSKLPEKAGEQVDWISMEKCFHALPAQINLYIVGRKMWEPKAALDELLLDYCRAVYGPANAEIMRRVYEVVEAGQTEVRYGMVQGDRYLQVLGTAAFKEKAAATLAEIDKVVLPTGWKANFPVVGTPQGDIEFLRGQLEGFVKTEVKAVATPAQP